MKIEDSLQCSQDSNTDIYREPVESHPYFRPTLLT
jgi:hypothetical protein